MILADIRYHSLGNIPQSLSRALPPAIGRCVFWDDNVCCRSSARCRLPWRRDDILRSDILRMYYISIVISLAVSAIGVRLLLTDLMCLLLLLVCRMMV